jgi:hypothetical protein
MSFLKDNWRLLVLFLGAFLVVGLTLWGLLALFGGPADDSEPRNEVEVPAAQVAEAEERASQFVLAAGTFGLNKALADADNLTYVTGAVYTNNGAYGPSGAGSSREENYRGGVEQYLLPGSTVYYGTAQTAAWSDYFHEKQDIYSYSVTAVTPVSDTPYLTPDGAQTVVPVVVTFTSVVNLYMQTDKSDFWRGDWNVYERAFTDNTITVYMVQDSSDGLWKVSGVSSVEYPYLLSTWATPDPQLYVAPETMQLMETLEPTVPFFPEPEEAPAAAGE